MRVPLEKRGVKPSYEIYLETVADVPDKTYAQTIDLLCEKYGVEPRHVIRQLVVGRPIGEMVTGQYSPGVFRAWKACMKKYTKGKKVLGKETKNASSSS